MRNAIIEAMASDIFRVALAAGLAVGMSVAAGIGLITWVVKL
jgi:hypothetical protein